MSEENEEVVRAGVDALNRGDADAFVALMTPDVEWEEAGDVLPGLRGIYRGRAQVRKWFEELLEPWESFQIEIKVVSEVGDDDRVFLEFYLTARGRASGAATDLRGWAVSWHADGKVT